MLLARNEIETWVYFDGVWMVPWRCLSQSWWLLTVWQKLTSALRMPNSRQDKLRPGVSAKHAQTVIPRQKASWSTSYGGKKNHQGKYFTKVPLSVFGGLNAFHIACVHAGKNPIWASQSRQLWKKKADHTHLQQWLDVSRNQICLSTAQFSRVLWNVQVLSCISSPKYCVLEGIQHTPVDFRWFECISHCLRARTQFGRHRHVRFKKHGPRDLLTSYTAQKNLESSPFFGDNFGWSNWSSQRIPNMRGCVYYFSTCLFSCRAKYSATEGILRSNTCSSKVLRSRYHWSFV